MIRHSGGEKYRYVMLLNGVPAGAGGALIMFLLGTEDVSFGN
jgi:hypothetical protein